VRARGSVLLAASLLEVADEVMPGRRRGDRGTGEARVTAADPIRAVSAVGSSSRRHDPVAWSLAALGPRSVKGTRSAWPAATPDGGHSSRPVVSIGAGNGPPPSAGAPR
jgi:hypothetical protein